MKIINCEQDFFFYTTEKYQGEESLLLTKCEVTGVISLFSMCMHQSEKKSEVSKDSCMRN